MAGMVVTALRDGYGIADPGEFRYRAWNEKKGNDPFDLPRLGLPREKPRKAKLFDGEDLDGRPYVSRPPVDAAERERLLEYLRKAPIVLAARGFDADRLEPGGHKDVPMAFHTDGEWVWPGAVGYYLRKHDVAPEPDLVDHVRRMDFQLPEVDERARAAALSVITGPKGAAPARPADQTVRRSTPDRPSGGRSTAPDRRPTPSAGAADEENSIEPLPGEPPLSLLRDRRVVGLPVDAEVDRHGDPDGNFTYAVRTPFERRSWPVEWADRPYHVYRLRRPLRVLTGVAVPWFDQPGGGIAYVLPSSVADLLADGTLTEVTGDR
ncbi:TNT domain-containing protein [Actinomadura alba]|uniref:TNT domain-containing protein n=2 Tax=Actinomadura alba TaxID=406431 RepID=A0ABR7LWK1_9ACTN|nr:TNT domain-containing protein [Actinomadura alba]